MVRIGLDLKDLTVKLFHRHATRKADRFSRSTHSDMSILFWRRSRELWLGRQGEYDVSEVVRRSDDQGALQTLRSGLDRETVTHQDLLRDRPRR